MSHVEHAVELELDGIAAAAVRSLFDALEAAGIEPLAASSPHAHPHVSVAVARDAPPDRLAEVLGGTAALPLPRLMLSSIAVFLAPEPVLFLAVTATRELLDLNAAVHERLDHASIAVRPVYRPGTYVPHCTLAMRPSPVDVDMRPARR